MEHLAKPVASAPEAVKHSMLWLGQTIGFG